MIGQLHTEEWRVKITTRMENNLAHAQRLEDNRNRRNEVATPETTVAVPSEGRTDATKRARQDELETLQESANTGGASSSSAGADLEMQNDLWIQAATTFFAEDVNANVTRNESTCLNTHE